MASQIKWCKRFMTRHSQYVDFLSGSLIISLCLIVLLPKVHESFLTEEATSSALDQRPDIGTALGQSELFVASGKPTSDAIQKDNGDDDDDDDDDNEHLPIGEILICVGFITFYCIGPGLVSSKNQSESTPLLGDISRTSVVCCPSTRCPTSITQTEDQTTGDLQLGQTAESKSIIDSQDDTCVMLLNRHHTHHVHAHHHDHGANQSTIRSAETSAYGSISEPPRDPLPDNLKYATSRSSLVDLEVAQQKKEDDSWPMAVKYTLFALIFIALLITFDLRVIGVMQVIKIFRAAATGALLYIALYLVLPRTPASCRSCSEEVA